MGRRKNVIAPEAQTMDLVAQKKEENLSAVSQIFSKLGILGAEYNSFLFIQTAKHLKELHENSAIAFGAVILAIKEHEDHGYFYKALEQIDIHPRKASRYIRIATRYGKSDKLSDLSLSKLNVLDELTDPELEKLIDGEEVKGLTLDAIDELTATEARKRLREAEEKARTLSRKLNEKTNSLEAVIKQKSAKIDELEYVLRRGEPLSPEQLAGAKLEERLQPFNAQLQDAIFAMNRCIDIIADVQRIEAIGYAQLNDWVLKHTEGIAMIAEAFGELQGAINDIHIDRIDEREKAEAV